jgi:hypothetical protein
MVDAVLQLLIEVSGGVDVTKPLDPKVEERFREELVLRGFYFEETYKRDIARVVELMDMPGDLDEEQTLELDRLADMIKLYEEKHYGNFK